MTQSQAWNITGILWLILANMDNSPDIGVVFAAFVGMVCFVLALGSMGDGK